MKLSERVLGRYLQATTDGIDWDGLILAGTKFMEKFDDGPPDWITLSEYPKETELSFKYNSSEHSIDTAWGPKRSRFNAALKRFRANVHKYGLTPDDNGEAYYRKPDGSLMRISFSVHSGGPGYGKQLPVPRT